MRWACALATALVLVGCQKADEAAQAASNQWLGLAAPQGPSDPQLAPAGEVEPAGASAHAFDGARMDADMRAVVGFSEEMKAQSQMYGRISGFPSEIQTAEWVGEEFRKAGLQDVEVQTYSSEAGFWWPDSWEVGLLGEDGSVGAVLGSSVPTSGSEITGGGIEAPLVFVGEAGEVDLSQAAGHIAIQHTQPDTGAYADRTKVRESSIALIEAGAVGVINWIEQAGNMQVFDFGGCGGACFNIGGDDGRFLRDLAMRATEADAPRPRLRLSLEAGVKPNLSAANVIGLIPGQTKEIVVVNAHLDAWFSGAGDNADGVAVLLALARHYAGAVEKPARTLLFVGSGGHHSRSLNGPGHLVEMNGDLLKDAVLVINLEHLAQFRIDAVPEWVVHADEQPKTFGVSNMSPFLVETVKAGVANAGFVIGPEITESVPGDLGGYAPLGVARMQGIHSGPLYHTSGDKPDSISAPGLEKAARFYAFVIDAVAGAEAKAINP